MEIRTNNKPRFILYGYELSENQRKEFDYLSDEEFVHNQFFKYKGHYYDLNEFMRVDSTSAEFKSWHGQCSESFFSGVVIKYTNDCDSVIVGQFFC